MSKYMRHQAVIERQIDESIDGDNWISKFEKQLSKLAVQPRSVDSSIFEQINSIMNTKSKYTSVEAAVEDMKDRSGLTAYLNKMSELDKVENKKIASDVNNVINKKIDIMPIVIQKCPAIKNTLENYIKDTKGNIAIPAIIEKLKSIHKNDVSNHNDWDDEKLLHLISKLNLIAKMNNPASFQNYSNLGTHEINSSDIDPSNTDAFHSLNPVRF